MGTRHGRLAAVAHGFSRYFLGFLIGAYALAAVAPAAGAWMRGVGASVRVAGADVRVSLPTVLLGTILFSGGLGVKAGQLRGLFRRPSVFALGLAANIAVPVLFLAGAAPVVGLWHDPAEAQMLLLGLAVVAAMPVAGSSAGWAQAADGDMALSLGLVLLSTLVSPLTTPAVLHVAGVVLTDLGADDLAGLASGGGTELFLAVWVILPTVLGVAARWVVGGERVDAAKPGLKLATSAVLLVLCYTNASACLPGAVAEPDWDFLALTAVTVAGMCAAGFAAGFGVARVTRAGPAQRTALVFGLGMTNNGTGQVLASVALSATPLALLPIIGFNLVQHLAAGYAGRLLVPAAAGGESEG